MGGGDDRTLRTTKSDEPPSSGKAASLLCANAASHSQKAFQKAPLTFQKGFYNSSSLKPMLPDHLTGQKIGKSSPCTPVGSGEWRLLEPGMTAGCLVLATPGLLAVDESIASPVRESLAAATTAANPA
ncbi:unnamed protein product [Rangifer tarandus platyrhynchus]|uniref:Uncharacterized protein n=2 Tax=Rangifer tarandus platyrhynchus TaxID=3082113 RepID=A0ABN8YBA9_RANTA|nr:unnamed protein product [Rangifer tarandus platyrhynchus]CAI9695215.1 unnamed protein product [Rangifer tarandus platyrhynchus]